MFTLNDKLSYLVTTDTMDVQEMIDILGQEGVYEVYVGKDYKYLNKELLFGVYVFVLSNVRLHKEGKTKPDYDATYISGLKPEDRLYTIKLTTDYDVLAIGKEHYYEFLRYVFKVYVESHVHWGSLNELPKESTVGRRVHVSYPANDIAMLLAFLRGYYGRYAGREEMRVAVSAIRETLNGLHKKGTDQAEKLEIEMFKFGLINAITKITWWEKTVMRNGKTEIYRYGLTKKDKDLVRETL